MPGEISLVELTKTFECDVVAVDGIDLEMPAGVFFTMVGTSGCCVVPSQPFGCWMKLYL